jgi:cobalt-zinc-cadmium efflux system outer membrane protein
MEATTKRNALRRAVTRLNTMAPTARAWDADAARPAAVRRANTEIALADVEASLLQARRELALRLAIPAEQADDLLVRGSLPDRAPPPPSTDELISLALRTRPDLAAFQLSVERSQANVQLNRAERWDDIFDVLHALPGHHLSLSGQANGDGLGSGRIGGPADLRTQPGRHRARPRQRDPAANPLAGLRDQVIYEVQRAAADYANSRQLVPKYESTILPTARNLRDDKQRRSAQGRENLDAVLAAEQNYDEAVQRYLEALVSHRRNVLRLNTVVGQRILP